MVKQAMLKAKQAMLKPARLTQPTARWPRRPVTRPCWQPQSSELMLLPPFRLHTQ